MAGKKYLDSSGLVTYDGLIKKHISGKFTDSTATFAGKASKSGDSDKLGGLAPASYVKSVKVGTTSYSPSNSVVSLPAYPTLSSLGAAKDASLTAHTGNSTIHITSTERTKWNAYSTTITALQNKDTSLDSSLKVVDSSLKTHLNDTTKHITAAERTRWNNTYTKSELDASYSDLDKRLGDQFNAIDTKLADLGDNINTHEKTIQYIDGELIALSGKVTAMGNVFKFKGTKAKKSELPSSGNEIGDVWHVNEDSNEYVYDASSKWELIGSAHTQVSAVASLTNGTKVGTITVDGATTTLYAPTPITPSITQVSADASLTSGTRIGTISVNNKSTVLYAPSKTSVTVTQNATSGINVGTINVDGVSKTLYITNPNTDSMVKHTSADSLNTGFPLLLAKTNGTATEEVYHTSKIFATPGTGTLELDQINIGNGSIYSGYEDGADVNFNVDIMGEHIGIYGSESTDLYINYYQDVRGDNAIEDYYWYVGDADNYYATHHIGTLYAEGNDMIRHGRYNVVSYVNTEQKIAPANSFIFGSQSHETVIATAPLAKLYHGNSNGKWEIWDSKNLSIARGNNLLHGTYYPASVFSNCNAGSDSTYGNIIQCKYPTSGTTNYKDVTYTLPLKLKNNGVYTLSFYVKADSAFTGTNTGTATGVNTFFYNMKQSTSGSLVTSAVASWGSRSTSGDGLMTGLPFTTAWKRVYITYTLTANAEKTDCIPNLILFRIQKACTHTIYVANIQLEEGVAAPTDYSEIGCGDITPLVSDTCDLGTDRQAWRMIHANGLHLAGMIDGESHTSNYGGMIYFGDSFSDVEESPDSGNTLTYIGETSDDELHVHAGGSLYLEADNDISLKMDTIITGTCSASGGFFETSDIRKKNIISELPIEKCYELVDKCQEIVYTLKSDPDKERVGMIAQEVECFFPEIVSEGADGYKSLDYAKLSVVCLRLLKDIIDKGGYKPKSFTEKVKSKFKKIFSKR